MGGLSPGKGVGYLLRQFKPLSSMDTLQTIVARRAAMKTNGEIGLELNLSESRVSNLYRVAELSKPDWKEWVSEGLLSFKHLEAVLTLPQSDGDALLRKAIHHHWSASQLRDAVRQKRGGRGQDTTHPDADIAQLEQQLCELLATRVRIVGQGRGGELRLSFTDNETLEGLLERLGWRPG